MENDLEHRSGKTSYDFFRDRFPKLLLALMLLLSFGTVSPRTAVTAPVAVPQIHEPVPAPEIPETVPEASEPLSAVHRVNRREMENLARALSGISEYCADSSDKALFVWSVLNKTAAPGFTDTIDDVLSSYSFLPDLEKCPVRTEDLITVEDIVERWTQDCLGYEASRELPAEYTEAAVSCGVIVFSNPAGEIWQREEAPVQVDVPAPETELEMLAKLIYGEARGIKSEAQRAAIVWCVLNRVDAEGYPDSISEVIIQDEQFDGYDPANPVRSNDYALALDVVTRWAGTGEGRVLPKEYTCFKGDGDANKFYAPGYDNLFWDWQFTDPYPALRASKMKDLAVSDREVDMIARVIYGTARNVGSIRERAAVAWVVMNRVQSPLYPDTVEEVILEENQFPAYYPVGYVDSSFVSLAQEVVEAWHDPESSLRVLPESYLYFDGDGKKNYFMEKYKDKDHYSFPSNNPYVT